jgi:quercetin dioxygenase-like cupin family protein
MSPKPLGDDPPPGYVPVRRVVTGHDAAQTAKVLIDGPAPRIKVGVPNAPLTHVVAHLWNTDATPCDIAVGEDIDDTGARVHVTPPPPNGSRFVVIDFPPGITGAMHRTETIDYVVMMAGTVDMVMDHSTVTLSAGDVMVQRGTKHQWVNHGPDPARIAFILIDAKPLGFGNPRL